MLLGSVLLRVHFALLSTYKGAHCMGRVLILGRDTPAQWQAL